MTFSTKKLTVHQQELADDGWCMADDDGWCDWAGCPQILDGFVDPNGPGDGIVNAPERPHRHCPRDIATRKRFDPDDEGKAGNG